MRSATSLLTLTECCCPTPACTDLSSKVTPSYSIFNLNPLSECDIYIYFYLLPPSQDISEKLRQQPSPTPTSLYYFHSVHTLSRPKLCKSWTRREGGKCHLVEQDWPPDSLRVLIQASSLFLLEYDPPSSSLIPHSPFPPSLDLLEGSWKGLALGLWYRPSLPGGSGGVLKNTDPSSSLIHVGSPLWASL